MPGVTGEWVFLSDEVDIEWFAECFNLWARRLSSISPWRCPVMGQYAPCPPLPVGTAPRSSWRRRRATSSRWWARLAGLSCFWRMQRSERERRNSRGSWRQEWSRSPSLKVIYCVSINVLDIEILSKLLQPYDYHLHCGRWLAEAGGGQRDIHGLPARSERWKSLNRVEIFWSLSFIFSKEMIYMRPLLWKPRLNLSRKSSQNPF